ncbi:hypothetical protein M0811_12816 [Anaeramoeba ignava]|uniref:Interferon-related developmental regulator N-terminal domain-containing protein n=1 Tax=Anaeramoeba ignava TaxID=1746090 RepID=A0A9Q0LA97_ANAIG|nr:hypothetical protein M0811_12816 [Anaeramoeba ignava]
MSKNSRSSIRKNQHKTSKVSKKISSDEEIEEQKENELNSYIELLSESNYKSRQKGYSNLINYLKSNYDEEFNDFKETVTSSLVKSIKKGKNSEQIQVFQVLSLFALNDPSSAFNLFQIFKPVILKLLQDNRYSSVSAAAVEALSILSFILCYTEHMHLSKEIITNYLDYLDQTKIYQRSNQSELTRNIFIGISLILSILPQNSIFDPYIITEITKNSNENSNEKPNEKSIENSNEKEVEKNSNEKEVEKNSNYFQENHQDNLSTIDSADPNKNEPKFFDYYMKILIQALDSQNLEVQKSVGNNIALLFYIKDNYEENHNTILNIETNTTEVENKIEQYIKIYDKKESKEYRNERKKYMKTILRSITEEEYPQEMIKIKMNKISIQDWPMTIQYQVFSRCFAGGLQFQFESNPFFSQVFDYQLTKVRYLEKKQEKKDFVEKQKQIKQKRGKDRDNKLRRMQNDF